MRLSTKMVVVTLGLVIVPLILLTASLFLLSVYRPRTLRVSYGQEDTNIMNINMIRRFDGLMGRLENLMSRRSPEELLRAETVAEMSGDLNDTKAYLLAYTDECYYNGGTGNQDVLRYVQMPEIFGDRDKLYFAGLSHPYLIGCIRFQTPADGEGSLFLVCDASGSLPSVTQIVFLISISVLALVGGSIIMLSWQRIKFAKPFKQLEEAAQSIIEGNLDFELVPESDDEFGSLTMVFEEMRQRLKNSAEEQLRYEQDSKILIGNISHDLKTPITAVKGYVEGIMDGGLPWSLIGIGAAIAAVLALLRVPVMPVAIGLYLPVGLSVTMFAGGLLRWGVSRMQGETAAKVEETGTLFSAGLVAGEGLCGIILALLALI